MKRLMALYASKPNNAIVIGDMVPLEALAVRCPRGPFCIPLSTSSKPMLASYKDRNGNVAAIQPMLRPSGALTSNSINMQGLCI
ncbi:MAG TPA: hypothetical protein VGH47_10625 [Xanthobacteraceae bacterium]